MDKIILNEDIFDDNYMNDVSDDAAKFWDIYNSASNYDEPTLRNMENILYKYGTAEDNIDTLYDLASEEDKKQLMDLVNSFSGKSNILPGPTTPQENGVASLLLNAINDEIATIDKYNVILANIQTYPEFILVIQDILNEENNHIGMLQELLKKVSPNAENISDGEDEAKELLNMNESLVIKKSDLKFLAKKALEATTAEELNNVISPLAEYNRKYWLHYSQMIRDGEYSIPAIGKMVSDDLYWDIHDSNNNLIVKESLNENNNYSIRDEIDRTAVENALEVVGYVKDAIRGLENGSIVFIPGIRNYSDLGYFWLEEAEYDDMDDVAEKYIDYDMLGSDLSDDFYGEGITAGEYWCGDEYASYREIGKAYVDEVGVTNISDINDYFNYKSYGKHVAHNFPVTFTKDGIIILWE